MIKTYISGAILKIKRPSGAVEESIHTANARDGVIPAAVFAKMVAATAAAGRGDILAQRPNVLAMPLAVQRMAITGQLDDCAGSFPGSAKWHQARALEQALAEFDAANPEILAGIQAARADRTAEGVARALRMED